MLYHLISVFKNYFADIELVYRPHPWRETFGGIYLPPSGLLIDPTLSYVIDGKNNDDELPLPRLSLYRGMMESSEFLIGGCTSMIIEASILRKKYLLLAHDDGNPIQSPFDRYGLAEHQSMTGALNNLTVCYDSNNLKSSISSLLRKEVPSSDSVLDYIISSKSMEYGQNLSKEINCLLD